MDEKFPGVHIGKQGNWSDQSAKFRHFTGTPRHPPPPPTPPPKNNNNEQQSKKTTTTNQRKNKTKTHKQKQNKGPVSWRPTTVK